MKKFVWYLVVIIGLFVVFSNIPERSSQVVPMVGSVNQGNEYKATTTLANTTAGTYQLTTTNTVLGSVIITSSSGSIFSVYDSNPSSTTTPTTTIAIFEANAAEGTYTFDVNVQRGVTVVVPSAFSGNFVVTTR